MSTHRRYLITRKADGAFWCGMFGWDFGWEMGSEHAEIRGSIKKAYQLLREICSDDPLTVEPADWYGA